MLEVVFARRRALFAAFALTVVAVLAVHPTWARSIGADVWNVPALEAQVRNTEAEFGALEAEDEEVRQRIVVKEAIITDLLAGRVTLAEATDQFLVLTESRPAQMNAIRDRFPGATDREKMARNVISFAVVRIPVRERDAAEARLEAELRQMLTAGASH